MMFIVQSWCVITIKVKKEYDNDASSTRTGDFETNDTYTKISSNRSELEFVFLVKPYDQAFTEKY